LQRLFDYIGGANDASAKIPMTAPVATKITPSAGPFCKSNFTVSFFVPFDYQVKSLLEHGYAYALHGSCVPIMLTTSMTDFPFPMQHDTPEPTSADVVIIKTEPFVAFVAQSGGYIMDDWSISKMAKGLSEVRNVLARCWHRLTVHTAIDVCICHSANSCWPHAYLPSRPWMPTASATQAMASSMQVMTPLSVSLAATMRCGWWLMRGPTCWNPQLSRTDPRPFTTSRIPNEMHAAMNYWHFSPFSNASVSDVVYVGISSVFERLPRAEKIKEFVQNIRSGMAQLLSLCWVGGTHPC
jgi:hypothetical protein